MNDKDLVLKILDKHRDMSLTMGCEVEYSPTSKDSPIYTGSIIYVDDKYKQVSVLEEEDNGLITISRGNLLTTIGHPATPLTLLKALGEKHSYVMEANGDHIYIRALQGIHLPLTTTLTELPHTHKLWTDLLPILS